MTVKQVKDKLSKYDDEIVVCVHDTEIDSDFKLKTIEVAFDKEKNEHYIKLDWL